MSPLLPMPADCLHQSVVETRDHWSCACAGRLQLCGKSAVKIQYNALDYAPVLITICNKTEFFEFHTPGRKSSEIKLVPRALVGEAHKKPETEISSRFELKNTAKADSSRIFEVLSDI